MEDVKVIHVERIKVSEHQQAAVDAAFREGRAMRASQTDLGILAVPINGAVLVWKLLKKVVKK